MTTEPEPPATTPPPTHPTPTTSTLTTPTPVTSTPITSTAPTSPNRTTSRRRTLQPNRVALLLGVALALTVTDPANLAKRGPAGWLLAVAALVAAIWAAPVVAQRAAVEAVHWNSQLVRHRNTVFAVVCTIIAGFSDPPLWLVIVDAALLLAYLLTVDALAAGPIGIRQLRRGIAPAAAAAASAVVLLGAHAPVNSGAVWGRAVAAVAVAAAALAAGAALWTRRHATHQPTATAITTQAPKSPTTTATSPQQK